MLGAISNFIKDSKTLRFIMLALFGCVIGLTIVTVIVGGGGLIAAMAVALGASSDGHTAAWVVSSFLIAVATIVAPLLYVEMD